MVSGLARSQNRRREDPAYFADGSGNSTVQRTGSPNVDSLFVSERSVHWMMSQSGFRRAFLPARVDPEEPMERVDKSICLDFEYPGIILIS